jgi:hypothetical protein
LLQVPTALGQLAHPGIVATSVGLSAVLVRLLPFVTAYACFVVAGRKGRNRLGWSVAGLLFTLPALVVVLLPPKRRSATAPRPDRALDARSWERAEAAIEAPAVATKSEPAVQPRGGPSVLRDQAKGEGT